MSQFFVSSSGGGGGGVASVVGTPNQIDVNSTDPANPILSIDPVFIFPGSSDASAGTFTVFNIAGEDNQGINISLSGMASANFLIGNSDFSVTYLTIDAVNNQCTFGGGVGGSVSLIADSVECIGGSLLVDTFDTTTNQATQLNFSRRTTVISNGDNINVTSYTDGTGNMYATTTVVAVNSTTHTGSYELQTNNGSSLTRQFIALPTGCQVRGNNTNTAPPTGYIGQLLTATATSGTLTSGTVANATSVSLTAGIWDVSAYIEFNTTGTVAGNTAFQGIISATTASTTPTGEMGQVTLGGVIPVSGASPAGFTVGPTRVSLASTTSIFLNAKGTGSVTFTNVTATGIIRAVRVA